MGKRVAELVVEKAPTTGSGKRVMRQPFMAPGMKVTVEVGPGQYADFMVTAQSDGEVEVLLQHPEQDVRGFGVMPKRVVVAVNGVPVPSVEQPPVDHHQPGDTVQPVGFGPSARLVEARGDHYVVEEADGRRRTAPPSSFLRD